MNNSFAFLVADIRNGRQTAVVLHHLGQTLSSLRHTHAIVRGHGREGEAGRQAAPGEERRGGHRSSAAFTRRSEARHRGLPRIHFYFTNFFITRSERDSEFERNKQTNLVESCTIHCTTHKIFVYTAKNGSFTLAPWLEQNCFTALMKSKRENDQHVTL